MHRPIITCGVLFLVTVAPSAWAQAPSTEELARQVQELREQIEVSREHRHELEAAIEMLRRQNEDLQRRVDAVEHRGTEGPPAPFIGPEPDFNGPDFPEPLFDPREEQIARQLEQLEAQLRLDGVPEEVIGDILRDEEQRLRHDDRFAPPPQPGLMDRVARGASETLEGIARTAQRLFGKLFGGDAPRPQPRMAPWEEAHPVFPGQEPHAGWGMTIPEPPASENPAGLWRGEASFAAGDGPPSTFELRLSAEESPGGYPFKGEGVESFFVKEKWSTAELTVDGFIDREGPVSFTITYVKSGAVVSFEGERRGNELSGQWHNDGGDQGTFRFERVEGSGAQAFEDSPEAERPYPSDK